MNSGAEANEGALKLARKWGKEKKDGAFEIICADNAFHGRTLQMITAGGTERYKAPFAPLPEGFVHVPFNDVEAVKRATTPNTVAIFMEPIQGEGGINVPDDDYFKQLRAWCDEQNILLILDEVQTGCGRIGTLFAYELLRRRAGHHDARQGHRRRRAALGVPREGALRRLHARATTAAPTAASRSRRASATRS